MSLRAGMKLGPYGVVAAVWRRGKILGVVVLAMSSMGAGKAWAQLQGHISIEKEEYIVDEPVYVKFEMTNAGKAPVQYYAGDRYSSQCSVYQIEVLAGPPLARSSCNQGTGGNCPAGKQIMAPGQTLQEEVLVNYAHDLSRTGSYEIHATNALKYGPVTEAVAPFAGDEQLKVEEHFQIRVREGDGSALKAMFRPYVAELDSRDQDRQREAARVVSSLAPVFLEDTILGMLETPLIRDFAVLGLKNLNTARSREALANIVQGAPGYTYQKEVAIRELAQMGDKKYFPLLLDIAQKQAPNQARDYVLAAAELGGDDALPYLRSLLRDPDPFSQANGVMGLEKTGSRAAVPLLIETLKSSEADQGKLALIGLTEMTHRSPFADGRFYNDVPSNQYARWEGWWSVHGGSAPVYGPRQCGEIEVLQ